MTRQNAIVAGSSVGIAVVLGFLGILISSEESGPREDSMVTFDCYCGEDKLATMQLYEAIARGDREASAGLTARNPIWELKQGTDVSEHGYRDGLTSVHVKSGFQTGRDCWLPSRFLSQARETIKRSPR